MDDSCKDDEMDSICERLKTIDLQNEEILVDFNLVEKVMDRRKTCLLVKLLTLKYYNQNTITMRHLRQQWGECTVQ